MSHVLDHYWLLDFDRTLSSVDVVSEMVAHVCHGLGLDYSLLAREHARAEGRGESFVVTRIIKELWPASYDAFCERLKVVDHLDSIFPDAALFIDWLESRNEPYAIITFGDEQWQEMKLHFSGLDHVPHIICSSPNKGDLIESWRDGTLFRLPIGSGVHTKELTFVDDKAIAFSNLPKRVRGFCVDRRHVVHPGDVPEDVPIVGTFTEIQQIIKDTNVG